MRPALALPLLLLALPAAAQRAQPAFAWPQPRLLGVVEVPGTLNALGIPVRVRVLTLEGDPADLWPLYAEAFRSAGLFIPPRPRQVHLPWAPMLTALDVRRRISYSVSLYPNPDGTTTTAVLGEANLALRAAGAAQPFAPTFPGAEELVTSLQEGARVMSYRARATAAQVDAFYADTLSQSGFERGDQSGVFTRGDEVLLVRVAPGKGAESWVVVVARGVAAEGAKTPDEERR